MLAAVLLAVAIAAPSADSCSRHSAPSHDSLVAYARRFHPEAWADSGAGMRIVGLVLDRQCVVRMHTLRTQRGGSFTSDEALRLLFPDAQLASSEISGMTLLNRDEPNRILIVWAVPKSP